VRRIQLLGEEGVQLFCSLVVRGSDRSSKQWLSFGGKLESGKSKWDHLA
jgi:hypothetical protein